MPKIQSNQIVTDETFTYSGLELADGAVGTPSLSFSSDPDTGFYRLSADAFGVTTGGSNRMTWENSWTTVGNVLRIQDGTAGTPGIIFDSDTDTGLYRSAADNIRITTGGTDRLDIFNGGIGFSPDGTTRAAILPQGLRLDPAGSVSAPFLWNNTTGTNTGFYHIGSGQWGFTSNGTLAMELGPSNLSLYGGGTLAFQALSTGLRLALDGSAATPSLHFANDTDTGIYRSTTDTLNIVTNGTLALQCDSAQNVGLNASSGHLFNGDGTQAAPAYSFQNDSDTGIYRSGANQTRFTCGGTDIMTVAPVGTGGLVMLNAADINSNRVLPNADNTYPLGTGSARYSEVFAAVGTINTSHSTTKYDIKELEDLEVPIAVRYKVKDDKGYKEGKEYIGYLNDTLPDEARPLNSNGTPVTTANYENAVVGILCNKVRKLEAKIADLETQINS